MALITIRNKPKVTIVIGMVKSIIMGLTMASKNESTAATRTAVSGDFTSTPGSR
jgi:hypothetical protein